MGVLYIRCSGAMPPLRRTIQGGRAGEKTFEVLVGSQRQMVSVDRLKPHTSPAPVTAANPAQGADRSCCRNVSHVRGSHCWRGLSVAVLYCIVIFFII